MTPRQKAALEALYPKYGIPLDGVIDFAEVFANRNPVTLEIGFGMGQSLLEMATLHPERNFVGVEVHPPGVGSLLAAIEAQGLENLKIIQADAVEVLNQHVSDESLAAVQIFFPDPWHKKRHHKRRLIQTELVELLVQKLIVGGELHLATDWQDYAQHMMAVLSGIVTLKNRVAEGDFYQNSDKRPKTKFEARGERLGHQIFDLLFCKLSRTSLA